MHARHAFGSASANQPFRDAWARILRAVRRQFAWLAREQRSRRAVGELMALDDRMLSDIGMDSGMDSQVLRLAKLAEASGLDGVVCSPQEIRKIRGVVRPTFKIVTPGIRLPGQSADDQERTATPRDAIAAGADYIVVGRAVTNAPKPRAALETLLQSL